MCEVEGKRFTFSIDQQHVVHAQASRIEESFPYFLLVHQVLNQEELTFLAKRARTLGAAEELLFESEIIGQDILLQYQLMYFESLFRVLNQKTGHYSFSLSLQTTTKPIRYALADGLLLLLREEQSEDWLLSHIPFTLDTPVQALNKRPQQVADFKLSKEEENMLSRLSEPATLKQLFSSLPWTRKEILKGIFLLSFLGLLCPEVEPVKAVQDQSVLRSESEPATTVPTSSAQWEIHLQGRIRALQEATHYRALGVDESAGAEEIKQSYYALAKKYHPDLFFGKEFTPQVRSLIFDLFEKIRKAYEVLKSQSSREQYDQECRCGRTASYSTLKAEGEPPLSDADQADSYFQQGSQLAERKEFEAALPFFRYAVTLQPNMPLYRSSLAEALRHNPRHKKEAEENFLRAIELDPLNVDGYLELGLFYKDAGFPKRAENQFRSALHHDPRNKTALNELKQLATEERDSGSFFGKILGSKGKKPK